MKVPVPRKMYWCASPNPCSLTDAVDITLPWSEEHCQLHNCKGATGAGCKACAAVRTCTAWGQHLSAALTPHANMFHQASSTALKVPKQMHAFWLESLKLFT
jgi:hypothetical protein